MFSEVAHGALLRCATQPRATPVRYSPTRYSSALLADALLRCATRRRAAPVRSLTGALLRCPNIAT